MAALKVACLVAQMVVQMAAKRAVHSAVSLVGPMAEKKVVLWEQHWVVPMVAWMVARKAAE